MRRHEFDGLSPSQIWVWHILPTIRWKTPNKSGPGATGCQWVPMGATGCYQVLLGATWYCWVLLGTAVHLIRRPHLIYLVGSNSVAADQVSASQLTNNDVY